MTFAAPERLGWLVLVPAALALAAISWWRWRRAAATWVDPALWPRLMPHHRPRRSFAAMLCLGVAVLALVLVLARPRAGASETEATATGGDVVFALDSSLSMAAGDTAPSRLEVARLLLRRLVAALPDQRLALLQWEAEPRVLSPLTTDRALIRMLADSVRPASLPNAGSDLGRALDAALDLLPQGGSVVLLTDGEDHGGALEARAVALAAAGVRVEAIGIGTPKGTHIQLEGDRVKRDASGRPVTTRLEEEPLERLAASTGGIYLRAERADADLAPLVARVQQPSTGGDRGSQQPGEAFAWPLFAAVLALAAHLWLLDAGAPVPLPRRRLVLLLLALLAPLAATSPGGDLSPETGTAPAAGARWWQSDRSLAERTADALAAGDLDTAVTTARAAFERHPGEPILAYNAGTTLLAAGDPDAAEPLEQAVETAPRELRADAWYNLGLARVVRGEVPAALAAFEEALRTDPEHEAARHNLEWLLRLPPPEPPPPAPAPAPAPSASPPPPPPQAGGPPTPTPGQVDTTAPPASRLDPNRVRDLLRSVEDLERRQHDQPSDPAERSTGPEDW